MLFIDEVVNQGLYHTILESQESLRTIQVNPIAENQQIIPSVVIKSSLKRNIKYTLYNRLIQPKIKATFSSKEKKWTIDISYRLKNINEKFNYHKTFEFYSFIHKEMLLNAPVVYVTKTGKRYHKGDCFHLRQSKIKMELHKAVLEGYTPCKHCILK